MSFDVNPNSNYSSELKSWDGTNGSDHHGVYFYKVNLLCLCSFNFFLEYSTHFADDFRIFKLQYLKNERKLFFVNSF